MAVTITRTAWIDDDGTGTSGSVINNAEKTTIYNQIDAALAQVLPLAGGTITGNLGVQGIFSASGFGNHSIQAIGTGSLVFTVRNMSAGTGNFTGFQLGNDGDVGLMTFYSFASNYASSVDTIPNGATIRVSGAGGFTVSVTNASAPMRFLTNFAERMRISPGGELCVGSQSNPALGQLFVATDGTVHGGVIIQNTNPGNTIQFVYFVNSGNGSPGGIQQTSASTVAYNTTSDARLKTDHGRVVDLSALRGVVVHDFTWTADGVRDRGVFAQEAAAVFPRAVTEGTDDETPEGQLARPWMTDYSKFVPDLIAGFQQHDAELAALRAAFATLKG